MMSDTMTIGDILDQLGVADDLTDTPEHGDLLLQDNSSPWYIEGLMGCGGWLAAIFIIGLFSTCIFSTWHISDETLSGSLLIVIGAVLTVGTLYLNYITRLTGKPNVFASQLSLAMHLAGHILLLGGINTVFGLWRLDGAFIPIMVIVTIALQLLFIRYYADHIFRFISVLVIIAALNLLVYDTEYYVGLSIIVTMTGVLVSFLWTDRLSAAQQVAYYRLLQPLGYALAIGMMGTIIFELTVNRALLHTLHYPLITSSALLLCLLWVEVTLLRAYQIAPTAPLGMVILGMTVIIALPTMTVPGIIASVLLILLAFRRRNQILLGLAYIALAGFIGYYYYSLNSTLLTKSIILMTTGSLLLLGRVFFRRIYTRVADRTEPNAPTEGQVV